MEKLKAMYPVCTASQPSLTELSSRPGCAPADEAEGPAFRKWLQNPPRPPVVKTEDKTPGELNAERRSLNPAPAECEYALEPIMHFMP